MNDLFQPEDLNEWLQSMVPQHNGAVLTRLLIQANAETTGRKFFWQSFQSAIAKTRTFVVRRVGRNLYIKRG